MFEDVTLIKNKHGRVVSIDPERKAYLLDPSPVHIDPVNGKRFAMQKQEHETGWTEPTEEEVAEWKEKNDPANIDAKGNYKGKSAEKPKEPKPPRKSSSQVRREGTVKGDDQQKIDMEVKVREAEGNAEAYNVLTDDEKELYLELFGEAPTGAQ